MYESRKTARSDRAARIVEAVCAECRFDSAKLLIEKPTAGQRKPVGADSCRAEVQRIACTILRERGHSLAEIAEALYLYDHTTVMYHLGQRMSRVERDLLNDVRRVVDRSGADFIVHRAPPTLADRTFAAAYGQR